MKFVIIFSTYCLLSISCYAQSPSHLVDSLSQEKLALYSGSDQDLFRKMIQSRDTSSLKLRLDTINASYIILEESYSSKHQRLERKEKYFFPNDSVQYLFVNNGLDSNSYFQGSNSFFPKTLTSFDGLFQQAFRYDQTQTDLIIGGMKTKCQASSESYNYLFFEPTYYMSEQELQEVNALVNEEFKFLYKIYTLIDLKEGSYWICFQVPPENPEILIYNNVLLSPHGW